MGGKVFIYCEKTRPSKEKGEVFEMAKRRDRINLSRLQP